MATSPSRSPSSGKPQKESFWRRLSQNGAAGLSLEEARKIRSINQFLVLSIASLFVYTLGYLTSPAEYALGIGMNAVAAALHVLTFVWLRKGWRALAVTQFLIVLNVHITLATYYVGPRLGYHYYLFPFSTVVFLIVPRRLRFLYPMALASLVLFIYFAYFADQDKAIVDINPFFGNIIRFLTIVAVGLTLIIVAFIFENDAHHAEIELIHEHDRSERLLLNVLPPSISKRLKVGNESIADGFAEVTVLFADIVGFTELSARLAPEDLVKVLSQVFSRFDDLAEELGLEKIKTIGDAYMVAAGLPLPRADHAVAATRMALRMIATLDEVNRESGHTLEVRIGINSGPVVAGVIGKKKFIYDLWGDTVNTASRMESHGKKSSVHVSESTAQLIDGEFDLEPRGTIHVKGKGDMATFFVVREKPAANRVPASRAPVPSASVSHDL